MKDKKLKSSMLLTATKNIKKKRKFKNVDDKICDFLDPRKTKKILDFNDRESTSIRSFAVNKKSEIKVTSKFMSGKLLIFAKPSLKSFIDLLAETFCFPSPIVKAIYQKYQIEKLLFTMF